MSTKLLNLLPKLALGAVCVLATNNTPSYAQETRTCTEVKAKCKIRVTDINQGNMKFPDGQKFGTSAMNHLCDDFYGGQAREAIIKCDRDWKNFNGMDIPAHFCDTFVDDYYSKLTVKPCTK
jgi:hypothetical protein